MGIFSNTRAETYGLEAVVSGMFDRVLSVSFAPAECDLGYLPATGSRI